MFYEFFNFAKNVLVNHGIPYCIEFSYGYFSKIACHSVNDVSTQCQVVRVQLIAVFVSNSVKTTILLYSIKKKIITSLNQLSVQKSSYTNNTYTKTKSHKSILSNFYFLNCRPLLLFINVGTFLSHLYIRKTFLQVEMNSTNTLYKNTLHIVFVQFCTEYMYSYIHVCIVQGFHTNQ